MFILTASSPWYWRSYLFQQIDKQKEREKKRGREENTKDWREYKPCLFTDDDFMFCKVTELRHTSLLHFYTQSLKNLEMKFTITIYQMKTWLRDKLEQNMQDLYTEKYDNSADRNKI